MKNYFFLTLSLITWSCLAQPAKPTGFKKTVLTRDFLSEGSAAGDLNKDGKMDVITGYYWFEAPHWQRHELAPSRAFDPRKEYSNSFLNLAMDVNLDGWEDVIIIDHPGLSAYWFENTQGTSSNWPKHIIADSTGIANESPAFVDINKDGRLDILCGDVKTRQIIWLEAPSKAGEISWKRHALSATGSHGTERYSHGIGYGDINMDGIEDVVIREGWFQGKSDPSSGDWVFHPANLGEPVSHMQILDINGDGRNDVMAASAHSLGIWWYEQIFEKGQITFKTHLLNQTTSQTHASILADMDGDGNIEFITGKRYLAHNGNDPGDADEPLLFRLEFTPGKPPYWKEFMIDRDSGAGLNITVKDMNQDGKNDLVIANKNGVFLLENEL